ncbi:4-phosphoerythronate dehydrogenase PdxB [Pseudomonas sp. NyZ704]|nr:4-phosphoerythronate dehydrogenase PdxB [Pseudomonas sp. NyZ704]
MHIVADDNIPLLSEFFAGHGRLSLFPGRQLKTVDLMDADVLLVRSVTRVDEALLSGTPVRFVGTCTIGTDHLDLAWLASAGIQVASAPGCNARGVVEYVLSCLLTLAERTGQRWQERVVGIVGVGQVGSRLAATLDALGVSTLLCDPLRAEAGEPGFVGLDELLARADVVSCHVPLSVSGAHATQHLLGEHHLQSLRQGAWLINSSRGPVIDAGALEQVLAQRDDLQVALDVWEEEPLVSSSLAARCALATPHVAGYSLDGKLRGTEQIYQALCDYLGESYQHQLANLAPLIGQARLELTASPPADWALQKAVRCVYDVRDDDARMRQMLQRAQTAPDSAAACRAGFDRLRKNYPLRREASLLSIGLGSAASADLKTSLQAAGFRLD